MVLEANGREKVSVGNTKSGAERAVSEEFALTDDEVEVYRGHLRAIPETAPLTDEEVNNFLGRSIAPIKVDSSLAWQAFGLCAQTDPELFSPGKGDSTKDAKAICARCEVRLQCLDYALENDERFGIWGGLSSKQRAKLKQQDTHAGELSQLQYYEKSSEEEEINSRGIKLLSHREHRVGQLLRMTQASTGESQMITQKAELIEHLSEVITGRLLQLDGDEARRDRLTGYFRGDHLNEAKKRYGDDMGLFRQILSGDLLALHDLLEELLEAHRITSEDGKSFIQKCLQEYELISRMA